MKRLKSRILASVLTVTMLIGAIPLEGLAMEPAKETLPVAEVSETEASEIVGECTDKRDEHTKQFLLSDGSFLVCQYVEPVHYYEDDTWKDIDNTLEEDSGEDVQENKNNDVKIQFSNKAKKSNMVSIKNKDYQVSWGILNARKPKFKTIEQKSDATDEDENPTSLKKMASSGIYENVFSGVDLRYTIVSKSVKEDIVLNHKYTRNTFSFDYQLKGLEMRLNENGEIEVYNSKEVVYVMDRPFMYDSNEKAAYSDKVTVTLTGEKGKYTLTLTADEEWLQASDRVYPVIIDPSVQPVTNAYNVKDTTRAVNSNISASAKSALQSVGEYVTMKVGSRYGSELQGLIYFDIPSVIPSSAKIINAQMGLYFTERATTSMQVNAHMITSDWNTSNISENSVLYGSSTPTHDSNVIDYQIFSTSAEYKYYMFDITSAVQKWSTGLAPNYGILLAAESVPQSDSYVRFCDSDHLGSYDPQYQVTYRDNKGLEDYWTYHTQALGKRATGYVNDYSGNLVIVENCFTMPGERMPFSFMLVYDQSRVVDTATYNATVGAKCGNGWRLACVQRLKENPIEGIRQTYPYIYTDGDGTEHYFVSDGNGTYQDEDGLGLTLSRINETVDENTTQLSYSIVTKDKITMKFDSAGFLRRIQDTESNTIAFHYRQPTSDPESSVLTSITDAVGRTISVGMGNDGWLMSAHTSTGEGFCYEYDEQGRLTSVVDKNSTETRYVYNENNCIVRVYEYGMNSPESVIEYTYTSYTPYRVASITEYTKNKTEVGRSISNITYDHNQTRFTDNKGRTQTYQFDTWGCTTSVINHEGAASTYSYEHEGNKNNKFSSSGKSQVNVRNYLYNTSGESNSAWSEAKESLDGSTVQGTVQYSTSQKYLGNRSFEASAESIGQARIAHEQNVYLAAGTYTLSAYLKTDNVTSADHGAGLSVQYVDANGNTVLEEGDWTTGTKDWHRQTLTFTVPTDGTTATVYLGLLQASGSAYFDAVQLEAGKVANKYNMLQDGSFEVANANLLPYWNGSNLVTSDRESTAAGTVKDGAKSFKFDGSASKNKMIYQTIPIQGNEGDVFSVSGWAKGASVNLSGDRKFSISTKVIYSDGTDKWEDHNFNTCVEDWQFLSFVVSTDDKDSTTQKTYTGLEVYFCYHQNENTVYIDNFQVNKDVGQTYVYDEEGNLISSASLAELETSFQYQNDNVKQLVSPDGSNYEYSYGYSGHNLLLGARSSGGVSYKFGYNVLSGYGTTDVGRILRTFKIKKNVEVTDNGKIII